jgi:hypothetical protein
LLSRIHDKRPETWDERQQQGQRPSRGLGKPVVVARAADADRPVQVITDNLGNRVRDEA